MASTKPKAAAVTYVLRTTPADGIGGRPYAAFQWPRSGPVVAPDWNPAAVCGGGLHGLLMGDGDGSLLCWNADALWYVLAVDPAAVVDLDSKVKFPDCDIVYCGDRLGATRRIVELGADPARVVGHVVVAGDGGTAEAGYRGTAQAGDYGTATAGRGGTAQAGDCGTATAGRGGTATAGEGGTATAGDYGTLLIRHWDGTRHRLAVAYVGEDGIKPNVPYRLDDDGRFVEVTP